MARNVVLCGVIAASVACSSGPDLQFMHEPVTSVISDPAGGGWIGLGPMSRNFRIDPWLSPQASAMVAFAQQARRSGVPVHATIWDRAEAPKLNIGTVDAAHSQPPIVLWLDDAPDPRSSR